jgi:hypothetical protein
VALPLIFFLLRWQINTLRVREDVCVITLTHISHTCFYRQPIALQGFLAPGSGLMPQAVVRPRCRRYHTHTAHSVRLKMTPFFFRGWRFPPKSVFFLYPATRHTLSSAFSIFHCYRRNTTSRRGSIWSYGTRTGWRPMLWPLSLRKTKERRRYCTSFHTRK